MIVTRLMGLGIAASVIGMIVGCSDTFAPPEGFGSAGAGPTCGPSGGAAVEIYLGSGSMASLPPNVPYARIYIPHSVNELEGESWVVAGGNAEGAAWYYPTATTGEIPSSGVIIVEKVDDDNNIEGFVDLVFPVTGRVRGDIRAQWVPRTVFCL